MGNHDKDISCKLPSFKRLTPLAKAQSKVVTRDPNDYELIPQWPHPEQLNALTPPDTQRPPDVSKLEFTTTLNKEEENDEETKCLEYSAMVRIFKPLIVQNLQIHDILPDLTFLDNHDDIYEEMNRRSRKEAVIKLLNELEKSKNVGKWQTFMNALYRSGYTYILDNIRGYRFINYHYQTRYIQILAPVIGKMISSPELLPFLMANGLLSDTDRENILCEHNNKGTYAGSILLLDRITKKRGDWYCLFIECLKDANYDEVVENLAIKELMDTGRVRDTDNTDTLCPGDEPREEEREYVNWNVSTLGREVSKLREKKNKLNTEIAMLEEKLNLMKEIVCTMKKRSELLSSIADIEEENGDLLC